MPVRFRRARSRNTPAARIEATSSWPKADILALPARASPASMFISPCFSRRSIPPMITYRNGWESAGCEAWEERSKHQGKVDGGRAWDGYRERAWRPVEGINRVNRCQGVAQTEARTGGPRWTSDWLENGSFLENASTPGSSTQERIVPECVRPLFMRVGGLQKRTGVRETVLGRGLWRHRTLPGRNLRIMLSSYVAEIQRFTAEGRSGLSPDRLERTERFRGKCARIGQKCGGVSPDLARREIASG